MIVAVRRERECKIREIEFIEKWARHGILNQYGTNRRNYLSMMKILSSWWLALISPLLVYSYVLQITAESRRAAETKDPRSGLIIQLGSAQRGSPTGVKKLRTYYKFTTSTSHDNFGQGRVMTTSDKVSIESMRCRGKVCRV